MYPGTYKTKDKSTQVRLVAVAVIFFTLGALLVSGQGGEIPAADTDRIKIVPLRAYVDAPASNIYYELTGDYFVDDANVDYDRCIVATYNVANLEVNRITCFIEISYMNSTIFIVGINGSTGEYEKITDFQNNSTVMERQIPIPSDCDIAIIIFYYGLRQVMIEAIFDYR